MRGARWLGRDTDAARPTGDGHRGHAAAYGDIGARGTPKRAAEKGTEGFGLDHAGQRNAPFRTIKRPT